MGGRPQFNASLIAQKGVPLDLLHGRSVMLCYTFRSLAMIEDHYGSIKAVQDVLNDAEKGKAFGEIARLLAFGLVHEDATDHGPISDQDVLLDYLDTAAIQSYGMAIGEAFTKAFPQAPTVAPTPGEGDASDPSRGANGSTSAGSPGDSPNESSGP